MKNIALYIATLLLLTGCESCGDSGNEPFNSEIKFLLIPQDIAVWKCWFWNFPVNVAF